MFWYTIGYAFSIAVILALLFSSLLNNHGPWRNIWVFALILFLGVWGFSLWFNPIGPVWYGVAMIDLLFVGLFLALLLGASSEANDRHRQRPPEKEIDLAEESGKDAAAITLFGILFWIFIVMLLAIILIGLINIF